MQPEMSWLKQAVTRRRSATWQAACLSAWATTCITLQVRRHHEYTCNWLCDYVSAVHLKLTLEPVWSKRQAAGESLLQGLLMAWQGMPADELADL